jgi:hypothetical protein
VREKITSTADANVLAEGDRPRNVYVAVIKYPRIRSHDKDAAAISSIASYIDMGAHCAPITRRKPMYRYLVEIANNGERTKFKFPRLDLVESADLRVVADPHLICQDDGAESNPHLATDGGSEDRPITQALQAIREQGQRKSDN